MKLVMAVIKEEIADGLVESMVEQGFRVTSMHTAGGYLRHDNVTILSAVEDDEVSRAIQAIKDHAERKKLERYEDQRVQQAIREGMVTLFVTPIEQLLSF